MATVAPSEERDVSIGRVFARAFGAIAANPLATLSIAFLFGALPASLLGYAIQVSNGGGLGGAGSLEILAVALASAGAGVASATIAQGTMVRLAIAHSEGGKATFGDSVGAGLSAALPLVAVAILASLGILVGLIFLIVPGLFFSVIWSVSAPALIEERLGPIRAMERSSALTDGARWKIFGLFLVFVLFTWTGSFVVETINAAGYTNAADAAAGLPTAPAMTFFVTYAAFDTVSIAMWGMVQASLYVELRDWKDGPATDALADIFG